MISRHNTDIDPVT